MDLHELEYIQYCSKVWDHNKKNFSVSANGELHDINVQVR